jgi:hypothetical protein
MIFRHFYHVKRHTRKTEFVVFTNYHMKFGPIWDRAVCQPAAHICGPSTAIAKGVRMKRDKIERQA